MWVGGGGCWGLAHCWRTTHTLLQQLHHHANRFGARAYNLLAGKALAWLIV